MFEDVHFDFDRYTLRADASHQVLDEVVAAMEEDLTLRIQIEGHTCNIGTAEYNLALGERRANAVQDYLSSRGISTIRFETISYGEERPQHDNSREETRRFNRRAALVVRLIDLATAPSTTGDDHLDQVETPGLLDSAAVLSTVTTAVRVGVILQRQSDARGHRDLQNPSRNGHYHPGEPRFDPTRLNGYRGNLGDHRWHFNGSATCCVSQRASSMCVKARWSTR